MSKGLTIVALAGALLACTGSPADPRPITPAILRQQPAIPYPPDLFARRVEGEVLLYLLVDSSGTVIRDSTRVARSSGETEFDAAALQAAATLRFTPAHRGDTAVVAPIQVPIQFHLPDSLKPLRAQP